MPDRTPEVVRAVTTGWRAEASRSFEFVSRAFDVATGIIELVYRLDGMEMVESFRLPGAPFDLPPRRRQAVDRALDLLHWTAGVSYWKAGCPRDIRCASALPDAWQADWLARLYREGLAEFAWRNNLDQSAWARFPAHSRQQGAAPALGLGSRVLVPMGGGKDSLVALERVLAAGCEVTTVQVGNAGLIRDVAQATGQPHAVIERQVSPVLSHLNQGGAFNGHVPITAINAAVLAVFALVADHGRVAFANERSADEATLVDPRGRPVNHQFSKSLVFERMLDEWIRRHVAADLVIFSVLRRDRELGVCREFSALDKYHARFSSCNRNFHLDGARTRRWCGQCPKCHFVFLALAPFMAPDRLIGIFGRDLLADSGQLEGFLALLALGGEKPFECVGEAAEARAAVNALAHSPQWHDRVVVRALADRLSGLQVPDITEMCRPGGEHLIPDDLVAHA